MENPKGLTITGSEKEGLHAHWSLDILMRLLRWCVPRIEDGSIDEQIVVRIGVIW